jgi:uncharacterized protein YlxW (UPF0749 family)
MVDSINALMSPATEEEQLKALAEGLRGRRQAADFFALSTIAPLQQMAQGQQAEVLDAAKQQGVLRKALADRQSRESREATRQNLAERQFEYLQEQDEYEKGIDAEQRKYDRKQNRLKRALEIRKGSSGDTPVKRKVTNVELVEGPDGQPVRIGLVNDDHYENLGNKTSLTAEELAKMTKWGQLTENKKAALLENFGSRMDKVIELNTSVEQLDRILQDYADKGTDFSKIPGFGRLEKEPGMIGGISRFIEDLGSEKSEASNNAAAVRAIMNSIGVARAGLAQTKTEIERIYKELGVDIFSDETTFMKYYPRLKEKIEADLQNIRASTDQGILRDYDARYSGGVDNPSMKTFRRFDWETKDGGEEELTPRQKRIRELRAKQGQQ